MKCVICHGNEIQNAKVNEEYIIDNNVVWIPIEVPVCKRCGERYYDRRTMQYLEETELKIMKKEMPLREIGKVLCS